MAEKQRSERPQDKAEPKHRQTGEQGQAGISFREEMGGKERRQHTIDVKIIPFDQRANRRSGDDQGQTQRPRRSTPTHRLSGSRHDLLLGVVSRLLTTAL
jgi:hypothetical protein